MAHRQQALAAAILKDPDVVSLSSFIGVDGSNNDAEFRALPDQPEAASTAQPRRQPRSSAASRRRSPGSPASSLYMQPVQDLTIDSSRSAARSTSFVLEDANLDRVHHLGAPEAGRAPVSRIPDACRRRQRSWRKPGIAAYITGHRPRHGGALRHHPGDRRQRAVRRFRPAHRLHHLHPVQPVPRDPGSRPALQHSVESLSSIYLPSSLPTTGGQVPLIRDR